MILLLCPMCVNFQNVVIDVHKFTSGGQEERRRCLECFSYVSTSVSYTAINANPFNLGVVHLIALIRHSVC